MPAPNPSACPPFFATMSDALAYLKRPARIPKDMFVSAPKPTTWQNAGASKRNTASERKLTPHRVLDALRRTRSLHADSGEANRARQRGKTKKRAPALPLLPRFATTAAQAGGRRASALLCGPYGKSSCAICTALRAAPLRIWSATTQKAKPCSTVGSLRKRPT